MKNSKLLILLTLFGIQCFSLKAQLPNLEDYHIWIQSTSNYHPITRVQFYALRDSSIMYTKRNTHYQTPLKNIANLYIRKKGKIAKGTLKGAGIGLLSGLLIAIIDGPPPGDCFFCISRQDKLLLYGVTGFIGGTGIGFGFGSKRKKVPINPPNKKWSFKQ